MVEPAVWPDLPGRRARAALRRTAHITAAFTVGHSLTLALGALTRWDVPAQPVEVLIALSILVGALHAVRPLFPGREAIVAGLFGLVHGMAFAFTLAGLDLTTPELVVSRAGFNLGIELLQLAVVVLVLSSLLVLARARSYRPLRLAGAFMAAAAALGWLADRLGASNPLAATADGAGGRAAWLAIALAVLAALTAITDRTGAPALRSGPQRWRDRSRG